MDTYKQFDDGLTDQSGSQVIRGPNRPDDVRNYDDGGLIGKMASYFSAGWNHLVKLNKGLTGGTAFPSSPAAGTAFYRTDARCWYHFDGTTWRIVGVEQSGEFIATPVQTINSTTATDVTGMSKTITMLGAGKIQMVGWVRATVAAGSLLILIPNINGNVGLGTDPVLGSQAADDTRPFTLNVAIAAPGTYTMKLQAAVSGAGMSASVTWVQAEYIVLGGT